MKSDAYEQNIVIDFEFTPIPKGSRVNGMRHEIIEIGAVRVDPSGRVLDEFRCLVRPEIATEISDVVRHLTGITWAQVEDAPTFAVAFGRLVDWIGDSRTRMVAWSTCDEHQVRVECAGKGLEVPASMSRWLDLQCVFPRVMGIGRPGGKMSLHDAIGWYGLELHASCEHAALLDAEHTAELLRELMTDGYLEQKRALAAAMPAKEPEPAEAHEYGRLAGPLAELYAQMCAASAA